MSNKNRFMQVLSQPNSWFPTLGASEQAVVYDDMRRNAIGNVDFYILILLASSVAYFGLQQDSSVVIIGAMLVAPLMSPMMAMGFAIVNGNLPLFTKATISTLAGILLAVFIAALITFLFPLKTVTNEILARTAPNILDLFIALSSGMAGAYALGRKEMSASLPGVAIAASLVPPLCVVGFGIGSGNGNIALNALLLFTTNLASIIVAGIAMFWLLGFRPDINADQKLFRTTVRYALVGVLAVAIPLTLFTIEDAAKTRRQAAVERILTDEVDPAVADVEDIVIEAVDDGFVVGLTLYLYQLDALNEEAAQQEAVEDIRRQLEEAVEGPVTIRARVIPSTLSIFERRGISVRELEP